MSSTLSPLLRSVSFDEMTAVSSRGDRLVYVPGPRSWCPQCAISHGNCGFGYYTTHCGISRKDGTSGSWQLAKNSTT